MTGRGAPGVGPGAGPAGAGTVGIVGAGTMGLGIAHVAAESGYRVLIVEHDESVAARALDRLRDSLDRRARRALPDDAARAGHVAGVLARARLASGIAELAHESRLVIEAVVEDLETKRRVFRALGEASDPDVILATNTSALSVTAIAAAAEHPERVCGLHFFNPVPAMRLVEVVATPSTAPAVVDAVFPTLAAWGKTPLRCTDSPGFIVNRVNRPFTLEALAILEAGEADAAVIDRAMRTHGYPMGPFELMDLIGIDVNLAVATAIHEAFAAVDAPSAERFRPTETQRRMVASGRLGRKTADGFYRYPPGPATGEATEPSPDDARIARRIQLAIIAEAWRALGGGIASRHDIDLALRLGAGHPAGPFELADRLGGPAAVLGGLRELERHGPRFGPPAALLAEAGAEPRS